MIFLEKVYGALQTSSQVYSVKDAVQAKITKAYADVLQKTPTTPTARLSQAIQLGITGGSSWGMSLIENSCFDSPLGLAYVGMNAQSVWRTINRGKITFGLNPFAGIAAALCVGSGVPKHIDISTLSKAERRGVELLQYGILGMPQAALINSWRHHADTGHKKSATACLVAAILVSIPLEIARTALALTTLATSLSTMVLFGLAGTVYHILRWVMSPSKNLATYACFTKSAQDYKADRERARRMWMDRVDDMAKPNTWGTNIEIRAAAQIWKKNFKYINMVGDYLNKAKLEDARVQSVTNDFASQEDNLYLIMYSKRDSRTGLLATYHYDALVGDGQNFEEITWDQETVEHFKVSATDNGACLFSAIGILVGETETEVRKKIVAWERTHGMTFKSEFNELTLAEEASFST